MSACWYCAAVSAWQVASAYLLDVFAELIKGGGANTPQLTTTQHRLQQVSCIGFMAFVSGSLQCREHPTLQFYARSSQDESLDRSV
jgi:hypothetical protein